MSEKSNLFKERELNYLHNTDFLITKREILKKLRILFKETEYELNQEIKSFEKNFPKDVLIKGGKLSKGENYRALPFLILDYPRLFKSNTIFAFRTMFWWGNFFSCTLHLQGDILENYREALGVSMNDLYKKNVFIGVSENPWEYHYDSSNYILIDELPEIELNKIVKEKTFIKISRYIKVDEYEMLPHFSSNTLLLFLSTLNFK